MNDQDWRPLWEAYQERAREHKEAMDELIKIGGESQWNNDAVLASAQRKNEAWEAFDKAFAPNIRRSRDT